MSQLEIVTSSPLNAGTPLAHLTGEPLPQQEMYVRCNFEIPPVPAGFELVVPGASSRFITLDDIEDLPQIEKTLVLECAGNGRTFMDPQPEGTPWGFGAVSPIAVRGLPLNRVLGELPADVDEVVFTGADSGEVDGGAHVNYQFSIDRGLASGDTPLLVTRIGGEPLTSEHGAPIRLVVPGHYAMKSVKWLTRVEAIAGHFDGHFVSKYRLYEDTIEPHATPVRSIDVRSIIAVPGDGETLNEGPTRVSGSAWTGNGDVVGVELSVDGGDTWADTEFSSSSTPAAAISWAATVHLDSGRHTIVARATDSAGNTQPLVSRWNANGYANNVTHRVRVTVV